MSIKVSHEDYIQRLHKTKPHITVLSQYTGMHEPIKYKCEICGSVWEVGAQGLLQSKYGCKKCGRKNSDLKRRKTNQEFIEELKQIHPNITPLEPYVLADEHIRFKCEICGYIGPSTPHNLLTSKGNGCPRCSKKEKYTNDTFKEMLEKINPDIEAVGEYKGNDEHIKVKCKKCGFGWDTTPCHLLARNGKNTGCPRCGHQDSWLQVELFEYFSKKYPSTLYRDKTLIGKELDIVIPELNIAIEPGSWYWHYIFQNRLSNDSQKQLLCEEKGVKCITIYDCYDGETHIDFPCLTYTGNSCKNEKLLQQIIIDIEKEI